MASRSDQLQSYQFMTQRVISALVMRETDPRQSPLRRGIGAVFVGLMVAIMVGAGFGIYGLLTKIGGNDWKSDGSVIIEKETGASYVYFNGTLHPTLNYASAMLVSGKAGATVFRVASSSLASVPRGTTFGIEGAPDSLPGNDKRVALPWSICVLPGVDNSGHAVSSVALAVGSQPSGGRDLNNDAMLVTDSKVGTTYLVWKGRRYQVLPASKVVPALFGAVTPVPVGTAWLNSLVVGVDIAPVAGGGGQSRAIPGRNDGDVLAAQTGSGVQYYVVLDDGLSPITPLQEVVTDAVNQASPIQVQLSVVDNAPKSGRASQRTDADPPATVPQLDTPGANDTICAATGDAATPPSVSFGGTVPGLDAAPPTPGVSPTGEPLADRVLVPAGRVCVVRVLPASASLAGYYFVVTDLGIKYPVPSAEALGYLGYSSLQATEVPAGLVNRIPTGPTLDPDAARTPVPVNQ
jgi:type VII secretion protein EccB